MHQLILRSVADSVIGFTKTSPEPLEEATA
ncbi:MAG: hypothetical protein QOJ80_3210 [Mycobacterium sp.]|jgi:hypothetical protein|nr:hypothetical protein [Mycobacterium sp.]